MTRVGISFSVKLSCDTKAEIFIPVTTPALILILFYLVCLIIVQSIKIFYYQKETLLIYFGTFLYSTVPIHIYRVLKKIYC